ncbi:MAG: hypothetical protein M3529_03305 [Actinomycetota bacterium]|nr:hypothetical protein [Actinomycetota bacterium]
MAAVHRAVEVGGAAGRPARSVAVGAASTVGVGPGRPSVAVGAESTVGVLAGVLQEPGGTRGGTPGGTPSNPEPSSTEARPGVVDRTRPSG